MTSESLKIPALIPFPQHFEPRTGQFILQNATIVNSPTSNIQIDRVITEWRKICKTVGIESSKESKPGLQIHVNPDLNHSKLGIEGYRIEIQPDKLSVSASDSTGLFYALQTLRQLIIQDQSTVILPCCMIEDWPAYPMRGVMHDVGRNFQELDVLKQQLDLFARYKINIFHWHLTDDPAWRIECKCFPKLNSPKITPSTRDPGKYYSYSEIRDLIQYAKERNILIIPEIDMPGHSKAFRKGIGTSMNSFRGKQALKRILQEFFDEIPQQDAPYLHIGSDEVHIWNPNAFIHFIATIVQANHRQIFMWNPGLEPPKDAIVQNWGAPKLDMTLTNSFVDSKDLYVNCNDLFQFIPAIYFHPLLYPKNQSQPKQKGGILCHWPDIAVSDKRNIYRHNPMHPAMVVFAERFWRGCHESDHSLQYLFPQNQTPEYREFMEFEQRIMAHRQKYFENFPFNYLQQCHIEWQIIGPFDHKGKYDRIFPPEIEIQPDYTIENQKFQWKSAQGATLCFRMFNGAGGYYPNATSSTAYALTYIHSPRDQEVPFWIGFEFKATSNRRYRGIPKQGEWDANGGKVWINDSPVNPPQWKNPGKFNHWWANTWHTSTQEIPYIDEEFYWTRPPTKISLKQGWNKLLLKIPITYSAQNWCVTCTPILINVPDTNPEEFPDLIFARDIP